MLLPFSLPLIVCSIPPLWIPALPLFQPCDAEDHLLYFFEMPINLSTTSPLLFLIIKKGGCKVRCTPLLGLNSLDCSKMPKANSATGLIPSVTEKGFHCMGKCIVRNRLLKYVFNSINFDCKSEYAYPYHRRFDANNIFRI